WETMLTARYPDRNIIFRNLGWDGDTVWAESRGLFDPPAKGYQRMLEHVGKIKPTVIFLGYGNNEAFAGKKGLPAFIKQYNKLIDDLKKVSAKGVRFVILSPIRRENLGPPLTDPAVMNQKLKLYTANLQNLAAKREILFVDLFSTVVKPSERKGFASGLTVAGIHLSDNGYKKSAEVLGSELGATMGKRNRNQPESSEEAKLRRVIIEKNLLYFYSWRPQNVTYLFLFRKHEQGQNAKEIEELRKLVAEKEKEIARLKKPVTHTYELIRVKEKKKQ
ncbi:MAG: hypothetical protein IID46_03855, partial [Planctomycetes bacterium]|nr:hypothetical protein [Planctomycetota bacterium]